MIRFTISDGKYGALKEESGTKNAFSQRSLIPFEDAKILSPTTQSLFSSLRTLRLCAMAVVTVASQSAANWYKKAMRENRNWTEENLPVTCPAWPDRNLQAPAAS